MAQNNAEGNHVSIDIEEQNRLLTARIEAEIPPMPSSLCYIYRVPKKFRVVSEDTYDPRIVSIGPFHRENKSLEATEKHKKLYLKSLISRTTLSLGDFVKAIRELEKDARECYAEKINLSSDEFVRMMIFDGCFLLELFNKYIVEEMNMESIDNLFGTTWIVPSLRRDLVLLENQIPFIVLERLFNLSNNLPQGRSLNELVTTFFDPILPTIQHSQTNSSIKSKHLLDLLRNHLLHSSQQMEYGDYPFWEYTHCVTDLGEAGVKFKKKDGAHGLLDVSFTDDGVFEIPPFCFGESWTVLLPNLIALEQCRRDYPDRITSYVILMDSLINSNRDVKLLRDKGIIDGLFHEDEKVARVLNNLCKGAVVDKFYYDKLCHRVNLYHKATWHVVRATLMRDYFNTPWAIVSFLAAVVLLVLTFLQTLYSLLAYYKS